MSAKDIDFEVITQYAKSECNIDDKCLKRSFFKLKILKSKKQKKSC